MTGIELIAQERLEQLSKHGRTIEGDVVHNSRGELLQAAIGIARGDIDQIPISWHSPLAERIMLKSPTERLAIAGALIAAEIDRINCKKTLPKEDIIL